MKDENCENGCRRPDDENGGEERRGRCCHSEPEASGARGGGECRCHAGKERGGSGGKGGGHCCCHSGKKGGAGCCSSGGGGDPRHGLKLWISAAAVALSFLAGEYPESLPLYPLTDPAWVAVILCAAPIFRAAGRSFFIERKITSPLLVSLAMAGAFALQIADFLGLEHGAGHGHGSYIFVAAEIAFLMSLGEWLEERTVRKSRMGIESLAKLLPGKNTRVRVTVTDPASLPQDRESMFWLYTRAIPSKVNDRENRLNINFVMRLKVFYRPKGMKGTMREAIEGLEWSWTDGGLVAKNASPFHISLASLTVNGVSHEVSDVIAPFTSMTFDAAWLPKGKTNEKTEVVWRAVSDLGGIRTGEADVARGRN